MSKRQNTKIDLSRLPVGKNLIPFHLTDEGGQVAEAVAEVTIEEPLSERLLKASPRKLPKRY